MAALHCDSQASLFPALGLRVVGGVPFRTPLSADAVYVRSLFFASNPRDERQHPQPQQHRGGVAKTETGGLAGDHGADRRRMLAARQTLLQLQKAGLTVWADAREIKQVQMTRDQLLQHLLHEHATPSQQQQMLRELDEASLHVPGLVAVQRLQDAAAVGPSLAMQYLEGTAGLALVADGTETPEEFQAVSSRPVSFCCP